MPGRNDYARVCTAQTVLRKNFKRGFWPQFFSRAEKGQKCRGFWPQFFSRAEKGQKCCGSIRTASAPQAIFGKTTENSAEFCCFPGWSWRNGYITAIFRAQFAAERIMPDYAQNLQNPDYAPNYAIMPGHNGEDPIPNGAARLEARRASWLLPFAPGE